MGTVPVADDETGNFGIIKRMVSFGRGSLPEFIDNSQVEFHWESRYDIATTERTDMPKRKLDDTRKIFGISRPMTLILGRSFRLPFLENCVKTMCAGEVATFVISDPKLIATYPPFAASLRSIAENRPSRGHNCAGMSQTCNYGYVDLDELALTPSNYKLFFTIELFKASPPGFYVKEKWQLSDEDRLNSLETFKEQGNRLVKLKEWTAAAATYMEALEALDILCSRDKPGEPEWKQYDDRKTVFFANLAQCQLQIAEYIKAVESCTQVIRRDPKNVKAYYRRAKALAKLWETDRAFSDWAEVMKLEPSLSQIVTKEANEYKALLAEHKKQEAEKLRAAFSPKS